MTRSIVSSLLMISLSALTAECGSDPKENTTELEVDVLEETYEFAAKPTANPPKMILFTTISPQWYLHKADYLAEIGVQGAMMNGIMHSWESDIWGLPNHYVPSAKPGRIVGDANPLFQLCKRMNQALAPKGITENSVKIAYYTKVPDWFNDAAWKQVAENFKQAGIFAQGAGFKGITLDIEYIAEMYNIDWAGYDTLKQYTRRSDAEMLAKAEQRGHEIMSAMLDGFPDMVHWHLPESLQMYGPIAKSHVKGMIRAMAERDAPGGFHISTEWTYLVTSPKGLISANATLTGAISEELGPDLMKYWRKRCSINMGLWPLGYYKEVLDKEGNRIGYTGKEETFHGKVVGSYSDKSNNYSVDDFRNQLGTVAAMESPYFWLYCHGQVLWQMTPEEMKEFHGTTSDALPVDENFAGYVDVITKALPITTPDILETIPLAKQGKRPMVEGVTPSWQVSGVYPAETPEMYRTAYAPEKEGAEVGWKTVKPESDGLVDLRKHVDKRAFFAVYGKARFEVEQDRKLVFRFGSNDWGSVFLDGKKLFEYANEEGRVAEPDQDSFIVNVKKGRHTVLIKCGDIGGSAWWYFFRITDAKGKAVKGVKWIENSPSAGPGGCP